MPLFKVGDHVERVGPLVPIWAKEGIITNVIPNGDGIDWATQYEVDFGYRTETFIKLNCPSLTALMSAIKGLSKCTEYLTERRSGILPQLERFL